MDSAKTVTRPGKGATIAPLAPRGPTAAPDTGLPFGPVILTGLVDNWLGLPSFNNFNLALLEGAPTNIFGNNGVSVINGTLPLRMMANMGPMPTGGTLVYLAGTGILVPAGESFNENSPVYTKPHASLGAAVLVGWIPKAAVVNWSVDGLFPCSPNQAGAMPVVNVYVANNLAAFVANPAPTTTTRPTAPAPTIGSTFGVIPPTETPQPTGATMATTTSTPLITDDNPSYDAAIATGQAMQAALVNQINQQAANTNLARSIVAAQSAARPPGPGVGTIVVAAIAAVALYLCLK